MNLALLDNVNKITTREHAEPYWLFSDRSTQLSRSEVSACPLITDVCAHIANEIWDRWAAVL